MLDRTEHGAARCRHYSRGIVFQRVAEGIIGGQEEPGLAALLHHRRAGTSGQRHRIVSIMHRVRRTFFIGQASAARADRNERLFLLGRQFRHRQASTGIGATNQEIDTLPIKPFTRLAGGNVRLVLMVGGHEFDLLAVDAAAEISNRHFDRFRAALSVDIGIQTRHIRDEADFDDVARRLGGRRYGTSQCKRGGHRKRHCFQLHYFSPLI